MIDRLVITVQVKRDSKLIAERIHSTAYQSPIKASTTFEYMLNDVIEQYNRYDKKQNPPLR